ncbi:hypothetical protein [Haloarchaeobius sp. DYHT-AS-18]|uniref:hypothetical protein n=1 Tax=Haloarchaeobius sp. DYHT-AS-18 TaxID=3446117 RepID=UPI003EC05497
MGDEESRDQNTHVEQRNESGIPDELGERGENPPGETDEPVPAEERERTDEAHEESVEDREETEREPGRQKNTEKESTTAQNQTNADNGPDEMPNQGPN